MHIRAQDIKSVCNPTFTLEAICLLSWQDCMCGVLDRGLLGDGDHLVVLSGLLLRQCAGLILGRLETEITPITEQYCINYLLYCSISSDVLMLVGWEA